MFIKEDHRLYFDDNTPVEFIPSPNFDTFTNPIQKPPLLIMHYTAGSSAESAIEHLTNDKVAERVSAHIVIGRDGNVTQLVPFDKIAWHAGYSYWEGEWNLNKCSIGIELDNDGCLKLEGDIWESPYTHKTYESDQVHPEKGWKPPWYGYWLIYPEAQYNAVLEVAEALVNKYGLSEILGHEDVSPHKLDPGPAFPMSDFRNRVLGSEAQKFKAYRAKTRITVYKDGDDDLDIDRGVRPRIPSQHTVSPLPADMPVQKKKTRNEWAFISVKKKDLKNFGLPSEETVEGWVLKKCISQQKLNQTTTLYNTVDPPVIHPVNKDGPIGAGEMVRVLMRDGNWALVTTTPDYKYVYGWVEFRLIEELQGSG